MKIKSLSLLLLFTGIIITTCCVDAGAQPPHVTRAPDNLFRSIFYPSIGILDHHNHEISKSGSGVPEEKSYPSKGSGYVSTGPGYIIVVHDLDDATFLLDRNIEKAEIISARLEQGIQYYKAEGKDVSKLEDLLEKYNLLIEDAKRYRALANASVSEENDSSIANSESCSSENTRREYLIKSQKSMIQANVILREIFRESQRLMPWTEELNNTSRVSAAGDGKVSLIGSFILNLHIENGDIAIPDFSPDTEVNITGDYIYQEKTGKQGDVLRLYHVYSVDANIIGSRKTVMLRGSNITLNASGGEGYAVFLGSGSYRIEDKSGTVKAQNWANPFPEDPEEKVQVNADSDEKGNHTASTRVLIVKSSHRGIKTTTIRQLDTE